MAPSHSARLALAYRQRWYVWLVYLGTPPIYSAISNVPSLKHDLASLTGWGPAFIALELAGASKGVAGISIYLLHVVARPPSLSSTCKLGT